MYSFSFLALFFAGSQLLGQDSNKKLQPPDAATAAKARAEVQEVFGPLSERAKSAAAKKEVAERMHAAANDAKEAPAVRWVLYALARDTFASAGDLTLALKTFDEQAQLFAVARLELIADSADKLAKGATAANSKPLLDIIYAGAEDAVEADDFKTAVRLLNIGLTIARKNTKDDATIHRFELEWKHTGELQKSFEGAKSEEERGKFYCFRKGDWTRGMPFLAKSQNEGLAAVAKKDMTKPADANDQVSLADAWFDLAEKANADDKKGMLRRAYWWYWQCVEAVSGLNKAKVEQRMKAAIDASAIPDSERATYRTKTVGCNGGSAFEDLPNPRTRLVGLLVHSISPNGTRYIHAIQPIYQNAEGKRFRGKGYGSQSGDEALIEAKPGYMVSGLVIHANDGVINGINGLQVKFVPIVPGTAKKPYSSNWAGGTTGGESTLEMAGKKIVGVYGRSGSNVDCLGLIFGDRAIAAFDNKIRSRRRIVRKQPPGRRPVRIAQAGRPTPTSLSASYSFRNS